MRYRKTCRGDTAKETVVSSCEAIKNGFLMPNSPNEVNITVKDRKQILAAIETLKSAFSVDEAKLIFDPAANHIGNMLTTNFLLKFRIQMNKQ